MKALIVSIFLFGILHESRAQLIQTIYFGNLTDCDVYIKMKVSNQSCGTGSYSYDITTPVIEANSSLTFNIWHPSYGVLGVEILDDLYGNTIDYIDLCATSPITGVFDYGCGDTIGQGSSPGSGSARDVGFFYY